MTSPNYGFHFAEAGLSASKGAITPAEQFFEGSRAEDSLARETGQNSIDARAGADPVVMRFELATMATNDLPGITDLRHHLQYVAMETEGSQGHQNILRACETANLKNIPVLKISDFGTKGLAGSESKNDHKTPLSALTRGAGISSDDGRGGSFGIGSAVGPMASNINSVFYTSLPEGESKTVFAGYSSLASHRDEKGTWRVGEGFYIDRSISDDFHYLRDPKPFGPFDLRTSPGTDLYIPAYRNAEIDKSLQHIKVSFMRNFFMAIHRGELIVHGVTPSGNWTLDSQTLGTHVGEDHVSLTYYRAIQDPLPVVATSKRLGELKLYIHVDDSLDKSLYTVTMRKPLMTIDTFRHRSIPAKYAAVLECSDDKANKLLRELEPPQHHKWDPKRGNNGASILRELRKFVSDGLRNKIRDQFGDQVEVKALAKYLPEELTEGVGTEEKESGRPALGAGSERESSTVQGAYKKFEPVSPQSRKKVASKITTNTGNDGGEPIQKGKEGGGRSKRKTEGGTLPGKGGAGIGSARITRGDVRFRSWIDPVQNDLVVALTSNRDLQGDLELVALGPGGSIEADFVLPITGVTSTNNTSSAPVSNKGNTLTNLNLESGVTTQIRLQLSTKHRYRIGVK